MCFPGRNCCRLCDRRWIWQAKPSLLQPFMSKDLCSIPFTESCTHPSFVSSQPWQVRVTCHRALQPGHVCQSWLNKDTWLETASPGQDLWTPPKPEVDPYFIQIILSLFGTLVGVFFLFLLSILQLRINFFSSSFLTSQGNNVNLHFQYTG